MQTTNSTSANTWLCIVVTVLALCFARAFARRVRSLAPQRLPYNARRRTWQRTDRIEVDRRDMPRSCLLTLEVAWPD